MEFGISDDGRLVANEGDAAGHMDLLTALLHETGHLLGLRDLHPDDHQDDFMAALLEPGTRRLPSQSAVDAVLGASG